MPAISESRYLVTLGWDDVPHLDDKAKRELLAGTPLYLRESRSTGTPGMGSGAIWPILPEDIMVDPFPIPSNWRRMYALDVGWNRTACLWLAEDPVDGTLYAYTEHYKGQALPVVHAAAIKARGDWIPGVIDPAARGRQQKDGSQLIADYQNEGLLLTPAINTVESGITYVWQLLELGRLKIFSSLVAFWREFRLYRRDKDGKVVKENDHLMDCVRYGCVMFNQIARFRPADIGGRPQPPADLLAGY